MGMKLAHNVYMNEMQVKLVELTQLESMLMGLWSAVGFMSWHYLF